MDSIITNGFCFSLVQSWAPVAQFYGLPKWVWEEADKFTTHFGFSFVKMLAADEAMIVHDSLHQVTGAPPSDAGEDYIAYVENLFAEGKTSHELPGMLTSEQLEFYLRWYQSPAFIQGFDQAEWMWERDCVLKEWIHHNGPLPVQY